jgi:hypothetical protein
MPHADRARQNGDQPTILVPEKVVDHARSDHCVGTTFRDRSHQDPAISRISIVAPGISMGISRATSNARSTLSAETNM